MAAQGTELKRQIGLYAATAITVGNIIGSSVFPIYFCQAVGLKDDTRFIVGCAAILLLTFVNWLGVKQGAGTQSVFTTAKLVGILGLCAAAFLVPASHAPSPLELPLVAGNA